MDNEKKMEGLAYAKKVQIAGKKNDYIRNTISGRYFLARSNMMAEQIISGNIQEKIDGCIKTMEYMKAELAMMKMQAIMSLRTAHFAKQDLMKDFGFTEEDILSLEKDYYNGKIIRDDYDEEYKRGKKAEFVAEPENKKS
jgi:hypothetical protein